ncbi:MAG: hypothetical protein HYZ42_05710 [Bacteroidetes bacterium]|nr:hypothetical protein [Bacteroidota bacterium]
MIRIFLILFCFLSITTELFAQIQSDTNGVQAVFDKYSVIERRFVLLIKQEKYDSCLLLVSGTDIRTYTSDSLIKEFKNIHNLLLKYKVEIEAEIGINSNGIGIFGHDAKGKFEIKTNYRFYKRKKDIYSLTTYLNDYEYKFSIYSRNICSEKDKRLMRMIDELPTIKQR